MTIATTTSRVEYAGDGVSTAFAVPFPFFAAADLVVRDSVAGARFLGVHYTVTGGQGSGGTVTMAVAPAVGASLTVTRNTPLVQGLDFAPNDAFAAEAAEVALDRLTTMVQDTRRDLQDTTAAAAAAASVAATAQGLATTALAAPVGFVDAGVSPHNFGARGDGFTDDSAAFQAAHAAIAGAGRGVLRLRPGLSYVIRNELAWFSENTHLVVEGNGSRLINGVADWTRAMIRFTNPLIPRTDFAPSPLPRCGPVRIEGTDFVSEWGGGPMRQRRAPFIEAREASDLIVTNCVFTHYSNGTALRLSALNNCYWGEDVFAWGAGHHPRMRSTALVGLNDVDTAMATARFSITAGGTALTVSNAVDVFLAAHVGSQVLLNGGGPTGHLFTITAVGGPRSATVAEASSATLTGVEGFLSPLRFTFAAGGATTTALSRSLSAAEQADMIGRMIVLPEGRNPVAPQGGTHRADHVTWIVAATATSVTVRHAPVHAVSNRWCATDPAVVILAERRTDASVGGNADFTFGCKIEESIGLGLYCDGVVSASFPNSKQHPANPVPSWGDFERSFRVGAARAWFSDCVSVKADLLHEGMCTGPEHARIVGAQGLFEVRAIRGQATINSPTLRVLAGGNASAISLGPVALWNAVARPDLNRQVATDGTTPIFRAGWLTSLTTRIAPDLPPRAELPDGAFASSGYALRDTAGNNAGALTLQRNGAGPQTRWAVAAADNGGVVRETLIVSGENAVCTRPLIVTQTTVVLEQPNGSFGSVPVELRDVDGTLRGSMVFRRNGAGPQQQVVVNLAGNDGVIRDVATIDGEGANFSRGLSLTNLPTSATGLPTGGLWRDGSGFVRIV
jgi:hypothetical protein